MAARAVGRGRFLVRVEDLDVGRVREQFVDRSWRTCARSASTGTGRWSVNRSAPGTTRRRWSGSRTTGASSAASARGAEVREAARRSTARRRGLLPRDLPRAERRGVRAARRRRRASSRCGCVPGGSAVAVRDRLHGERANRRRRPRPPPPRRRLRLQPRGRGRRRGAGSGGGRPRRRPAALDRRPGAPVRPARAGAAGVGARAPGTRPRRRPAGEAPRRGDARATWPADGLERGRRVELDGGVARAGGGGRARSPRPIWSIASTPQHCRADPTTFAVGDAL